MLIAFFSDSTNFCSSFGKGFSKIFVDVNFLSENFGFVSIFRAVFNNASKVEQIWSSMETERIWRKITTSGRNFSGLGQTEC